MNFYFSNGNKFENIKLNEKSLEKEFLVFLETKQIGSKDIYINTTKKVLIECQAKGILSTDKSNLDIFSLTNIEVIKNICDELKNGVLAEFNNKASNRSPHACLNANYLDFLTYYQAYMLYRENLRIKKRTLQTMGGESSFSVFYKEKCCIQVKPDNGERNRSYSVDRFLKYCIDRSFEEGRSYTPPLFDDILQYSNIAIKPPNKDFNEKQGSKQMENQQIKNQPLNQILYGSPGTGKTYCTIDKALEIIMQKDRSIEEELREEISNILTDLKSVSPSLEKRKRAKEIFDDFKNKKQIEFVTFHQNYGYEEFVEGIKPKLDDSNSDKLEYKIQKGVFKALCEKARKNFENSHKTQETLQKEANTSNAISLFLMI